MKKLFVIQLLLLNITAMSYAQKPLIDTSVFRKWPKLRGRSHSLSSNGIYASYIIDNLPVNNSTLVIRSTTSNWKRAFTGGEGRFTSDSRYVVIKLPGDSLCICKLGTDKKEYIDHAGPHNLLQYNNEDWLVYQINNPEKELVLRNLFTSKEQHYNGVCDIVFSEKENTLLLRIEERQDSSIIHKLECLDMQDGKLTTIWQGESNTEGYIFSNSGNDLAFFVCITHAGDDVRELWSYRKGETTAKRLVGQYNEGIRANLGISPDELMFSKDGSRIFFKLVEQHLPQAKPEAVKVDIWNYKDGLLQSEQLMYAGPRLYLAVVNMGDGKLIRLQEDDDVLLGEPTNDDRFNEQMLIMMRFKQGGANIEEWYWNQNARPSIILVNTRDGSRKLVKENAMLFQDYTISPDSRWLIYYDREKQGYCSFDTESGTTLNLTKNVPVSWLNKHQFDGGGTTSTTPTAGLAEPFLVPPGFAGWHDDGTIMVYDEYDIWQLDPSGIKPPANLTNGYGRKHHIRFRLALENAGAAGVGRGSEPSKWMLRAFDTDTKYSGFYQLAQGRKGDPEKMVMGPWRFDDVLVKANDTAAWIMQRESPTEAPNCFITRDLKIYAPLSDLQPQKQFNWYTAELHHWRTPDGTLAAGILYKPENFNPHKKYPVLFNYYQERSDELYQFEKPEATGSNINIPYFINQGYLVFVPDIHYKMGATAQSITGCVESAAKYIATLAFVNAQKMGIQGISNGGYETDVLVTHTHLFAAAVSCAGPSDLISWYAGLRFCRGRFLGKINQWFVETHSSRIGATLWQRPDLFINNSPIFQADKVTTPTLIVHGEPDGNVSFEQSIEFYTALRRLGKKVWMLQYEEATHGISKAEDAMDFTIRLTQFFNYYLKEALPPKWMTEGVPARLKGIETGLGLDISGKIP